MTDGERMIWAAVFALEVRRADVEPAVASANWTITRVRKALAEATANDKELKPDTAMLAEMVC